MKILGIFNVQQIAAWIWILNLSLHTLLLLLFDKKCSDWIQPRPRVFFFKIHEIVTLYLFPSGNRFFFTLHNFHVTNHLWKPSSWWYESFGVLTFFQLTYKLCDYIFSNLSCCCCSILVQRTFSNQICLIIFSSSLMCAFSASCLQNS